MFSMILWKKRKKIINYHQILKVAKKNNKVKNMLICSLCGSQIDYFDREEARMNGSLFENDKGEICCEDCAWHQED